MIDLHIASLLRAYRKRQYTVRQLVDELNRAADEAPESIWIARTPRDMLDEIVWRLAKTDPGALPLYGIPFVIKDNIDLAGVPTTAGCPAFTYLPKTSATVVRLLIEAGAVPMGKTNMDQFATGLVGVRSPYGAVPNRIAPGYVSGGSSSGSAAALAYRLASFSLGTDTAGSGRVPAAFNELVGLKPSRGLLSTQGVVPACRSLDCVSIFAGSVREAQIVFELVCRADRDDAYSVAAPPEPPRLPPNWKFGVPQADQLEFFGNEAYERSFRHAVERLEAAGGTRVEIDFAPFLDAAKLLYDGPWVYERYAAVGRFIESREEVALPVIENIIVPKKRMHPASVFEAMYKLQGFKADADRVFADVHLIVTPTTGTIYRIDDVNADPIRLNSNLGYYTNYMNLLDYCAVAVPGRRADSLPFGITLVGKKFSDRLLLECAEKFERVMTLECTVAVLGAHLAGCPLHGELKALGAEFSEAAWTAPKYRMYAFQSGNQWKPALVGGRGGTTSCYCELYRLNREAFSRLTESVSSPLAIGKIELADGRMVSGFVGEAQAAEIGEDISSLADWRLLPGSGYTAPAADGYLR